jgi:hypothetical protein
MGLFGTRLVKYCHPDNFEVTGGCIGLAVRSFRDEIFHILHVVSQRRQKFKDIQYT